MPVHKRHVPGSGMTGINHIGTVVQHRFRAGKRRSPERNAEEFNVRNSRCAMGGHSIRQQNRFRCPAGHPERENLFDHFEKLRLIIRKIKIAVAFSVSPEILIHSVMTSGRTVVAVAIELGAEQFFPAIVTMGGRADKHLWLGISHFPEQTRPCII